MWPRMSGEHLEPGQESSQQTERKANHGQETTLKTGYQLTSQALNGIGSGLVHWLTRVDVAVDFLV